MTAAVDETLRAGGSLIVQAPTGVGKSIAYLSAALASGQKVVVATSSIALQDQLSEKDLPYIAEQLSEMELRYAVLKGRSNYLCRAAFAEVAGEAPPRGDRRGQRQRLAAELGQEGVDQEELEKISTWISLTETGDRAQLSFEPSPSTWQAVSTSAEECPGKHACNFGSDCFAEQARSRAEEASIVIVNTHLYALHVASQGWLLPAHDAVVFDEAHEVEAVFTSALGAELTEFQLQSLARQARRVIEDEPTLSAISRAGQELGTTLNEMAAVDGPDRPAQDLRLKGGARADQRLAVALDSAGRAIVSLQRSLETVPSSAPEATRSRAARAKLGASALLRRIAAVSDSDAATVVWINGGRGLKAVPLEVGETLQEWFWSRRAPDGPTEQSDALVEPTEQSPPPRSVIFTSATIPTGLGRRLQVPTPRQLAVESPFDFRSQAVLYVPKIPDPRRDPLGWKTAVHAELVALIKAAGGRTLALFTSLSAMRDAANVIGSQVSFPLLVQGDKPKHLLLSEFAKDHATCLFATRSFFQGVDVPGQSLSVVVLDRIPFPRPGEPLIDAWQDAAGGGFVGFSAIAIPLAATVLAQAAGRLIRSRSDRGVVAVLDARLAEANYRSQLLKGLPPMRRTRDRHTALSFLTEAVTAPGQEPANPDVDTNDHRSDP